MIDDYPILVFWSPEDGEYIATVPDLRGCSASGATPEEAVREARIEGRLWLEAARANGWPPPIPAERPTLIRAAS
jgi:predicted RNase H-like HicB family nuclease